MSRNWLRINYEEDIAADESGFKAAVKVFPARKYGGAPTEGWMLTADRERITSTPDSDIIWVKTEAELKQVLNKRYQSPPGFSCVWPDRNNFDERGRVFAVGQAQAEGKPTANEYCSAARAGVAVTFRGNRISFLVAVGYEEEEAKFLIYDSHISLIPISTDLVLDSSPNGDLRLDVEANAKAHKALKRSRTIRTRKKAKGVEAAAPIKVTVLKSFIREARDDLYTRLVLPSWILFDFRFGNKCSTMRQLLGLVELWERLLHNRAYRQLKSYRELIIFMAKPGNMAASEREHQRKYKGKRPYPRAVVSTDAYADFLQWIKGELLYAKRYKWLRPKKGKK